MAKTMQPLEWFERAQINLAAHIETEERKLLDLVRSIGKARADHDRTANRIRAAVKAGKVLLSVED